MDAGFLNKYFKGVAAKHLSAVEADAKKSNQHEYNGVAVLKKMLGNDSQKTYRFQTTFLYLEDDVDPVEDTGTLTWYDSRKNIPGRSEFRLYYPGNEATNKAEPGDSLFICLREDSTVLDITAKKDSVIESQLFWLFDVRPDENSNRFVANTNLAASFSSKADFAARLILQKIGIDVLQNKEDYTDLIVAKFGRSFPSTHDFSEFARSTVKDVDPVGDPDGAIVKWYDRTEDFFMCMESIVIEDRLKQGFVRNDGHVDVDGFIQFSLSVNNRRKSRAGLSFEDHLEALFNANKVRYSHTPVTENKSKPDFIFPSIELYRDDRYPAEQLTMLGAKTTAKDRWRQVLEEANKINRKHLITLQPAISENQTKEMISWNLQLVVPASLHPTYTEKQQTWLYSVSDFLKEVEEKQAFCDRWRP